MTLISSPTDASPVANDPIRIGVDLGGTKIEAVALAADGSVAWRERKPTPKTSAEDIYDTIAGLVERCDS